MFRKVYLTVIIIFLSSVVLNAHCDGLDGPVIGAAKKALETGNINYVLIWVNEKSEAPLKKQFDFAYMSKQMGDEQRQKAENSFFSTLVRLHREAEGEEFTGVKPAGRYKGTAIPLADKAIEIGSMEPLKEKLTDKQIKKLEKYFDAVISNKNYNPDNITAGRKFVASYVEFFHHLEHLIQVHHEG